MGIWLNELAFLSRYFENLPIKRGFPGKRGVKWPILEKVSRNLLTPVQEQTTVCL